ncbi:hypothetical protein RCO27_18830 [Sphingosinicella sp. LHD-64]|uniref:hypothetical protein n=1 Tax=Sphingosinicella sp. LHD-64 TaxID=3072139 RepID=UPI00280D189F|nr:hypothetical protein [Sphingosinicella sp. LHD-64]MDQ8758289.1 hypothetical protein [Sphingosinicella sp. LHD-64]
MEEAASSKPTVRKRAEAIKPFRCKNLIAVIENPTDVKNIGTVIRNVNALGVEKVYVIDPRRSLPDDWQDLREQIQAAQTKGRAEDPVADRNKADRGRMMPAMGRKQTSRFVGYK